MLQVLRITAGGDRPVRRAAMDALLRRMQFAKRDELKVVATPPGRRLLDLYTTKRKGSASRPYVTWLGAIEPLVASCACADFAKSSLGLCKHLLVVIDTLAANQGKMQRLHQEHAKGEALGGAWLPWDPVRPLAGDGDWLERLTLDVNRDPAKPVMAVASVLPRIGIGVHRVRDTVTTDPVQRQAVVRELLRLGEKSQLTCEPAVLALLHDEEDRLERRAGGREQLPAAERALASMKRALYPYQLEGVRRFLDAGRLLLADDMGLGKAAQAIASCHAPWHAGAIKRGLLLVPASLKHQWGREWEQFTAAPLTQVDGSPDERRKLCARTHSGFLAVNDEQVLRDLPAMAGWKPQLLVLAAAQRIKHWATKTAVYVKQLDTPYRLVLTGTPMENRLDELASLLELVDT